MTTFFQIITSIFKSVIRQNTTTINLVNVTRMTTLLHKPYILNNDSLFYINIVKIISDDGFGCNWEKGA